jgi:hypothetical protein
MTQAQRILRALERGPVVSTDFIRPSDGGDPVLRVAARVNDLIAQGHRITSRRLSNGTAEYTLHTQPVDDWRDLLPDEPQKEATHQGCEQVPLFDAPAVRPSRGGFAMS